jgi:hypothetical protein
MLRLICFFLLLLLSVIETKAQCYCSFGNPVGGTLNMGVMDKNTLRFAVFYRYSNFKDYYSGDKKYTGENIVSERAYYNYTGLLAGYGITSKLTIETEGGYYFNKTQVYAVNHQKLSGSGLSNIVISVKRRLFYNYAKKLEISWALGPYIPLSTHLHEVNGVTLPVDLQPSIGSYGFVFQSYIIKEDYSREQRFFLVNRIEKYFENKQNTIWGTFYSNSFIFSKHYTFQNAKLKDWTFILQLKNQIKSKDIRKNQTINSSGNCLFFVVPQINLSVNEKWNLSILSDIPVYQYYNEIQMANAISLGVNIIRDLSF